MRNQFRERKKRAWTVSDRAGSAESSHACVVLKVDNTGMGFKNETKDSCFGGMRKPSPHACFLMSTGWEKEAVCFRAGEGSDQGGLPGSDPETDKDGALCVWRGRRGQCSELQRSLWDCLKILGGAGLTQYRAFDSYLGWTDARTEDLPRDHPADSASPWLGPTGGPRPAASTPSSQV